MFVPKFPVLIFLCFFALILMVFTMELHMEYSEINKLDSRLTSEIRHPQHIVHSRYLIRTNALTNYQCIIKIDGLRKAVNPKMGMALCSDLKWWEFYK